MQRSASRAWSDIALTTEQHKSDKRNISNILEELLPGDILSVLQRMDVSRWHEISKTHDSVAVVFVSVKNLAILTSRLKAGDLVTVLHTVFSVFDRILKHYNMSYGSDLSKIETVQDTYLVCSGLSCRDKRYVFNAYSFAIEAVNVLNGIPVAKLVGSDKGLDLCDLCLDIHGGVAVGPILSGVVGSFPRFCIFGNVVNTAARMMQIADPGTVRVVCDDGAVTVDDLLRDKQTMSTHEKPMDKLCVNFMTRTSANVSAKGVGHIMTQVLVPCEPTYRYVPSEQKSRVPSAMSRLGSAMTNNNGRMPSAVVVNNLVTSSDIVGQPSSSSFYALRSHTLIRPITVTHRIVCVAFVAFLISILDGIPTNHLVFLTVLIVSHLSAPVVFRMYSGSTKLLNISTVVVLWVLTLMVVDLSVSGSYFDHNLPEFFLA